MIFLRLDNRKMSHRIADGRAITILTLFLFLIKGLTRARHCTVNKNGPHPEELTVQEQ